MNDTSVEKVVAYLNDIVASDGGQVTLLDTPPDAVGTEVHVRYEMNANEACDTCSISADMLEMFLTESLRTHGVQVDRIVVEAFGNDH